MDYRSIIEREGLPANVNAERLVLGSLLSHLPDERPLLEERFSQADMTLFSLDSHQRIYEAAWHVFRDGLLPDIITVATWLQRKAALESVGGRSYIMSLVEDLPRHLDITNYVIILREAAQRRALLSTVEAYANEAVDIAAEPKAVIQNVITKMEALLEDDAKAIVEPIGVYLSKQDESQVFESLSRENGLRLGWAQLDELTGGLQGGDLMIVAARPSMGKTAWAGNVFHDVAVQQGKRVLGYTLEQKKGTILGRMSAGATRTDSDHIRSGRLDPREKELILQYRRRVAESGLFLVDTPKLTVTDIRAQARRVKRLYGLNVILIDQLSKVNRSDVRERNMPKHEQVGEQTTALKHMAQELDVPVIVLNQIGRSSTKNTDHRPTLSDLKESGAIEEDADLVLFLHRPEYFDRSDESLRGKGEMILEKNREGKTGTVKCVYNASIQRWMDPTEVQPKQQSLPDDYYVSAREDYPW